MKQEIKIETKNGIKADVKYRAGNEIVFNDGFEVTLGSDFHGYIARFDCSSSRNTTSRKIVGDNFNEVTEYLKTYTTKQKTNKYNWKFNKKEDRNENEKVKNFQIEKTKLKPSMKSPVESKNKKI